jgi:hypothetical protein
MLDLSIFLQLHILPFSLDFLLISSMEAILGFSSLHLVVAG